MADLKKLPPEDDGRTVADMNVEGFKWYRPKNDTYEAERKKLRELNITPSERRAMIKGALSVMLPVALGVMLCVAAVFMIAYFWLR